MYTNSVPALLSKNVGNALSNYTAWNDVMFNVKKYGAKGDGITDDTTAIQAAIDAANVAGGGVVMFPPGAYLSGVLNHKTDVWLMGAGMEATTLKAKSGLNDNVLAGVTINYAKVSDMTIDGNGTNQTAGSTVTFFKCRNIQLFRVKVINSYDVGLNMSNVEDSNISHCIVDGTRVNTAISFSNDDAAYVNGNNVVTDCIMQNAYLDGIIYNTNNGVITNNIIRNNGINPTVTAGGIYSNGKKGLIITDNIISGNDGNGIDLLNCTESSISNNQSYYNNSAGIFMSGCTHSTITGNTCKGNGKSPATGQDDGITLANACFHINITGNRCFDDQGTKTQQWGIDVGGSTGFVNVIGNNTTGNVNTNGIRNTSTGTDVQVKDNLPFTKSFITPIPQSFSVAAGATYALLDDNTKLAIIEVVDQSLQAYGRFFLRGSNNSVSELSDPQASFETTDTGTTTVIYHNGTGYMLKNRKAGTSFYSYMITYI